MNPYHRSRKATARRSRSISSSALGNETSYGNTCFRKKKPSQPPSQSPGPCGCVTSAPSSLAWATSVGPRLLAAAGEHIDSWRPTLVGPVTDARDTVLRAPLPGGAGTAWHELMGLLVHRASRSSWNSKKPRRTGPNTASPIPKATAASRPAMPSILTEWLTGVYHARVITDRATRDRQLPSETADFKRHALDLPTRCCTRCPVAASICCPPCAVINCFKPRGPPQRRASLTVEIPLLRTSTSPPGRTGDKLSHVANMITLGATEVAFHREWPGRDREDA